MDKCDLCNKEAGYKVISQWGTRFKCEAHMRESREWSKAVAAIIIKIPKGKV